ncbi:helix-turn-helix domain-containing protein [Nesterenkonia lutea]|uniref:AraC-like DNA-binding protein n=1 Tax=Nesterenkonia lutea TaxID=272919 RepID=A0ABR9JG14_9MICC|nr:helix-turn-helix domain-containing protein [Nesterenkonia lutea]MBE1524713.1 AraC-like DNA-binding protein [Nesterenkonia lutea]
MSATTGQVSFDAAELAPRDRFEAWRHAVNAAFVPLDAHTESPAEFHGALTGLALGSLTVAGVGGDAVTVRRSRQTIAAGDPGVFKFALQVHGSSLTRQDGREAMLAPGDLVIYDTRRPYDLVFGGPYRMFVVQIPVEQVGLSAEQARAVVAQRIPGSAGLGALTSSLLGSLDGQLQKGEISPDPRAASAVLQLVQATLLSRFRPAGEVPTRDVVYLEAVRHIDDHLGDPELGVDAVARALHVSLRYLQGVFAQEGTTISEWIRHRRLERCRMELGDPAQAHRSVSAVAARWGYPDASSFSRAFRHAYGVSPGAFRRQIIGG